MTKKDKLALFKFRIIAHAFNNPEVRQQDYFRKMAERVYHVPGEDKPVKYKPTTFKKWLHLYRKHGLDGLKKNERRDKGVCRRITEEQGCRIQDIAGEHPFRTVRALYEHVIQLGVLERSSCTYATFNTYAAAHKLVNTERLGKKRKSFEKPFINMLWVGDIMYGPYVTGGRRGTRSYLVGILDDCSRFPVGALFCTGQDTIAVERVLKQAMGAYGIPGALYLDNARVFISAVLVLAGARLGFTVVHSKKGDAASRGKIERFYRTVRDRFLDRFLAMLKGVRPTLDELNKAFARWLHDEYLHRRHATLGESPHDRYMKGLSEITVRKASTEKIRRAFLHETTRKVSRDALVSIRNEKYEVPGMYIGSTVTLHYDPAEPKLYYIYAPDSDEVITVHPVDRHGNSRFPIRFGSTDKE